MWTVGGAVRAIASSVSSSLSDVSPCSDSEDGNSD